METLPEKMAALTVNEIYQSVQGESSWAGLPCVFIRLTFCNLRCTYCDTSYAFYEGGKMPLEEIVAKVEGFGCPLVELTGGEPLLQPGSFELVRRLCDKGLTVLIETSGSIDIAPVDPRAHIIMDLKCPSSGECAKNRLENIPLLARKDEVKFVIGSEEDYLWTRGQIAEHRLDERVGTVLLSPVFGKVDPRNIVEWMLRDRLRARFQIQMHKVIWPPQQRGV